MKDFVKLTKETWQFYLTALCILLLPVVSNNIYILKQLDSSRKVKCELFSLADIFLEKADGYDLINFWVALFGIVFLLFVRHFVFVDKRVMEFNIFLPVKKRKAVMHDYFCCLGVFVVPWLVTMCTFTVAQSVHNHAVLEINGALRAEAENAGRKLWEIGSLYLLYLVFAFTLLYLGIVIFKNSILGMAFMAVVWGMAFFLENLAEDSISGIGSLVSPEYFLNFICNKQKTEGIVMLAEMIILIILLIVLAADKRELSKGKWSYFPIIDMLLTVLGGVFVTLICYGIFFIGPLVCLVVGVSVFSLLCCLLNQGKHIKSANWEVK